MGRLDPTYILFSRTIMMITATMVKAPIIMHDKKPLSKFGASAGQKTRGHQARNASCSGHQSEQIRTLEMRHCGILTMIVFIKAVVNVRSSKS